MTSPPSQPDPAIYLRNMAFLWRWDPALAVAVDAVADHARYPVEPTKSGDWTLARPSPAGPNVYLHSRYDPPKEAATLAESAGVETSYGLIVGGMGLGYHLLALRKICPPDAVLVISEPDIVLIATALATVDLTPVLEDGNWVIMPRNDKADVHDRLRRHTAVMMLGTRFVPHPPSQRLVGEFHKQARALVTDFIAYSRMTLMTLVGNARITCRNIAANLPRYVSTPPIDVLRERFAGKPAIVVSAGPSLRRNIHLLPQAKGRAVICAVQTALKPLLQHGVRPDFVTSLDFHEISRQYFEGAGDLSDIHLVAEPKATWHVIDHFNGPVSLLNNEFAHLLIGEKLAARDGLPAGATVAHLAFYLARYMGCNPIILTGQDLAFTGHVFYVPGVEVHRIWRAEMNRFNTLETKEWERIARNRDILRRVPGQDGKPLYTDELLFTYLEQFEKDIAPTQAQVINATEGGARIRGAEPMPLADVLATYCRDDLPAEKFAYRREMCWSNTERLPQLREQLVERRREVEHMDAICEQMLERLDQLQQLTDQPTKFNQVLISVDELRTRLHGCDRAYHIIHAATQMAELRRFSADRRLSADTSQGAERARRQLARDVEFVTAVRDGATYIFEILDQALQRVDAAAEAEVKR